MKNRVTTKPNPVILTPDQRLRIFISSTLKEMANERKTAKKAITNLHLTPVMFEMGARPHLAQDLYQAYLEQSHIFIGIYGEQYGWVAPGSKISGLEEEYRLAKEKPKLIYIKKCAPNRDEKLHTLLQSIRDNDGISYKYFSDDNELQTLIENDIAHMLSEQFSESQTTMPTGLPTPTTPILGREKEIQSVTGMLLDQNYRLITLTGPGGSGKTRLSLEVGRQIRSHFEKTCFTELTAVDDPGIVAPAIAQSIGIREAGSKSPENQIIDYLRSQTMLLILDNFEQIADAAPLVSRLLEHCPQLKILVTSRTALKIRGEQVFRVEPLAVPKEKDPLSLESLSDYPAIDLFYQRARSIKPDFDESGKHLHVVAQICRHLDGLPLAIELAATRIRIITPQEIADLLQERFSLLTGGHRDLPERQRTMYDTIAWSYELLDNDEATLFRRLAIFAGGCSFGAVKTVCTFGTQHADNVLDTLESLVNANLIRVNGDSDTSLRFEMLETIHAFALERLTDSGEAESLKQRHATFFVQYAKTAEPYYRSNERNYWLDAMESELDNLRVVFRRSMMRQIVPKLGLQLVGELGWFCHLRGHLSEGRQWASSMLTLSGAIQSGTERAKALFPAGGLAWSQSDYSSAQKYLQESTAIFRENGNRYWQIQAQVLWAASLASTEDYTKAFSLSEEAVNIAREIGDRWGEAYSLYWLGDITYLHTRDMEAVQRNYTDSLAIYRELNDHWGIAEVQGHLGIMALYQGIPGTAQELLEESVHYMEMINDRWAIARGLAGLGEALFQQEQFAEAKIFLGKSLILWNQLGNTPGTLVCLDALAKIAIHEGNYETAAWFSGYVTKPFQIVGILIVPAPGKYYLQNHGALAAHLSDAQLSRIQAETKSLEQKEIVNLAMEYIKGEL